MKLNLHRLIFSILIFTVLTGCSARDGISVSDPWTRPALEGGNGAAYMVFENNTGSDDVLLSATTVAAADVELHDVIMGSDKDDGEAMDDSGEMSGDNSMMRMVKQENVPIPEGETVTFEPGSLHFMLIGLTNDLVEGDTIKLTLVFQNAGEITVETPVEHR